MNRGAVAESLRYQWERFNERRHKARAALKQALREQHRLIGAIAGKMEQSTNSMLPRYDFPLICNYGRFTQMVVLLVQTYVIYSEWDRVGTGVFLPLLVMFAIHGQNAFVRWRDSIDGRFDVKQLMSCSNNSLRLQYALAVFTAPILALVTWWFLYPEGISFLNSTLYFFSTIIKVVASCGILFLEAFEVSKDKIKGN